MRVVPLLDGVHAGDPIGATWRAWTDRIEAVDSIEIVPVDDRPRFRVCLHDSRPPLTVNGPEWPERRQ
ncbi:hypothetical protein GCM10022237_36140 [Nocardioides ginsengisoli]